MVIVVAIGVRSVRTVVASVPGKRCPGTLSKRSTRWTIRHCPTRSATSSPFAAVSVAEHQGHHQGQRQKHQGQRQKHQGQRQKHQGHRATTVEWMENRTERCHGWMDDG